MKFVLALAVALLPVSVSALEPVGRHVVDAGDFSDAQSQQWRESEQIATRRNVASLRSLGFLARPKAQPAAADLQWPLKPVGGFDQFGYHGVSNFVDHDTRFPGFVQDYSCGTRSYDLASGYNHAGTDYFLWPFAWLMMDEGQIRIVAAASGTIVNKADGNFDRDCAIQSNTNSNPNFVEILQDDGLYALYLHMRNGSVTQLPVGARIAVGDYLGLVGSSGDSSAPHLHFELRDANGVVVDPRHGQCNAGPDRWEAFQAYEDPHIDSLSTHSAEPTQIVCGYVGGKNFDDAPHYQSVFAPGDTFWVFASYRDQRNGEVSDFNIQRPDGSQFTQWNFDLADANEPKPFYAGTSFDWQFSLPDDAPTGTWTITAQFQGQKYERTFTVGSYNYRANLPAAVRAQARIAADALHCRALHGNPPPPDCKH
ncbi:MAG: peptidoglycan DD-metalloendopeptidase family protein [Rudaea sp.]